jgi:hypothetical protein
MRAVSAAFLLLPLALTATAQKHDIGLTLGRIGGPVRTSPAGELSLDSGIALQANYGYRFLLRRSFALFAEVHFLANGQREIRSQNLSATRDVATAYVAPGLRIKLTLSSRISPYLAAGGGYALYEQSHFRIDEQPNPAPRFTHRGAVMFGGGVDVRLLRWLGFRFEARDFYTGNPSFNAVVNSSGLHNTVVSGGFVLSFGERE